MTRRATRTTTRATARVTLLVGVAIALVAVGCSRGDGDGAAPATTAAPRSAKLVDDGTPVDGGTLKIGVGAETNGWNPHINQWANPGATVGSSILEPLAVLDDHFVAQPWLAKSFTPNATYDTWTLELQPGVTFHDGSPFDAASVKVNLDDAVSAPLSGVALKGMVKQVTATGPLTVSVELNQPWASFPTSFLAGQSALQMAPAMLASADSGQMHPIGTGPFSFDEWKPDSYLRVKKNPRYWRQGEPHLDGIEFHVLADQSTQTNALQAHDVDMFVTTSAQTANQLASDHQIVKNWQTEPNAILANTLAEVGGKPNPAANHHARMALALATDRAALADVVGDGVLTPTSPFSPENPWGQPDDQNGYPDHDPDKARAEVQAYQQETGQPSMQIEVLGNATGQTGQVLQTLQAQWKAVGIDASIVSLDPATQIQRVITGNYQFSIFANLTSPEPDQDFYFWSSSTVTGPGGININFSQYATPEIDADLKVGREQADVAARKRAYTDIVRRLNAEALDIWLFWTPYSLVADNRVHGLAAVAEVPFANFQPKTWYGRLWLSA